MLNISDNNYIKLPLLKFCLYGAAVLAMFAIFSDKVSSAHLAVLLSLSVAGVFLLKGPSLIIKHMRLICLSAAAACLIAGFHFYRDYRPALMYKGEDTEIDFEVTANPKIRDDYSYVFGKADVGGKIYDMVLYLDDTAPVCSPGDVYSLTVPLYFINNTYHLGNGIFLKGYADKLPNASFKNDSIAYFPLKIKESIRNFCTNSFSDKDVSDFIFALTTGDKDNMSEDIKNEFSLSGTSHIMAVSGLHVSIIVSFIILIFGKRIGSFIAIPIIIVFASVSGFSPSAVRAVIMSSLAALAFIIRRDYDVKTAFAAALFLILAFNPFTVYNISFQLSFLSVLGIILFMPALTAEITAATDKISRLKAPLRYILLSVAVSFSAVLFTNIVTYFTFDRISVISLISNIFVIFPVTLILCAVSALYLLWLILPGAASFLAAAVIEPAVKVVLHAVHLLASPYFASVNTDNVFFLIFWIFVIVLSVIYLKYRKNFEKFITAALFMAVICFTSSLIYYKDLYIIETGLVNYQPMAYIHCPNGTSFVIGGGDGKDGTTLSFIEDMIFKYDDSPPTAILISKMNKANITGAIKTKEKYGLEVFGSLYTRNEYPLKYTVYENNSVNLGEISVDFTALPYNEGVINISIGDWNMLWLPSIAEKRLSAYLSENELEADAAVISEKASFDDEITEMILEIKDLEDLVILNNDEVFWLDDADVNVLESHDTQQRIRLKIRAGRN